MFNQNNEEKKLDWMYKGPNSLVEREEYLLGRTVDKTLEQLNEEDKQKQQGVAISKNRVEHECIPPSIRDFNKVVQAEQVDLSAKLQEDPLVAIKKREEETRRQFLQNPVQLKKLQKALKAQQAKKNKKKKKKKQKKKSQDDGSDSDLDKKLTEKLLGRKRKIGKEERNLDTILIHKYEEFKDKLTESDLQDILNGKITDSEDSSEEEEKPKNKLRKKWQDESEDNKKSINNKKEIRRREQKRSEFSDSDDNNKDRKFGRTDECRRKHFNEKKHLESKNSKYTTNSRHTDKNKYNSNGSSDDSSDNNKEKRTTKHYSKRNDDDSDSPKHKKTNYGLVTSSGEKIALSNKHIYNKEDVTHKVTKVPEPSLHVPKHKAKRLTEEEKEKLRREMMENAAWRDQERVKNVRKYREKEEKEKKEQDFDPDFIHKQLLKSADGNSIENRIKANVNNIQRSRGDMDRHFSKRE